MPVLNRRPGEAVVLGNIQLTVVANRGNQVRLGFTAPPDVSVQREELRLNGKAFGTLPVHPTALEAES
jgi:carbon storage regulator